MVQDSIKWSGEQSIKTPQQHLVFNFTCVFFIHGREWELCFNFIGDGVTVSVPPVHRCRLSVSLSLRPGTLFLLSVCGCWFTFDSRIGTNERTHACEMMVYTVDRERREKESRPRLSDAVKISYSL